MLSTRQGIYSVIVGTTISIINAIIQFLTMYWVLEKFGTEFNGYIRLVSSFSSLISTAEGALGIATSILLARPLVNNDWISANEIYSTSKKCFKRSALINLGLVVLISFSYPLYAGVHANGNIFSVESWKNIGLKITGINGEQINFAPYWMLVLISLIFGSKNFVSSYWFTVYETIIIADNRNAARRVIILFRDIIANSLMFILLAIVKNPLIPFIPIILYSPIKGLLVYFYVRKKYLWIKFYKDFNSFKLNVATTKISNSNIGTSLLLNSDIAIVSVILGLNVSSTLSLYLVVALNVRIIMTNFIVSFREFFVALVSKWGRLKWSSYAKYELYLYLITAFTFINMSILSPYFVSALYSKNINIKNDILSQNAFEYMFYTPYFSLLYASVTALAILCDGQMTLIQAKGRYGEVSRFKNIVGIVYIIVAPAIIALMVFVKIGGEYKYVFAIVGLYSIKLICLVIGYCYLWVYVWKYITYNSSLKFVLNNFLILIIPSIIATILNIFLISQKLNIKIATQENARIFPLIELFFGSIFVSLIVLILFSYSLNAKTFNGIIKNFPIIQKRLFKKSSEERKKHFEEYGIDVNEIVDNSGKIKQATYGIEDISLNEEIKEEVEKINVNPKNKNIYILKGK